METSTPARSSSRNSMTGIRPRTPSLERVSFSAPPRQGTGPRITRQSSDGSIVVIPARMPSPSPAPSPVSHSSINPLPNPRLSSSNVYASSTTTTTTKANTRGHQGPVITRVQSVMGEAPPPPLSSSPPPAPTTLHQRDETSESTSSIRTTWIQGGFTPKASQDPLIITQTSSSQPPIVNPLQPSNVNPSPSILPPPPTDTSVVTPTPTRTTKMQKIQISKPFTRIPSNRIFSSSSNPTPLKRYQLHQGRNRFLLGGLLMTSRDNVLPFLASLLLAIILPILWITFVGRGLWENDNNNDRGSGSGGMKGVVIVFVYLTLIFWSSMIKTSLSDPGILPRNLDPQPIRKYVEHDEDVNHSAGGKGEFVAEIKYLRVKDGVVGSKWCETCEIYRPPRTSHCRLCDNCVELTDHHCAFLNNCIGRRNYFPFLTFLLSSNLLLLYSISFTAYYISQTPNSRSPTRWDSIGSYILLVVLVAVMVPVGGLGIYHARLVWKNRTTIEMLRPKSSRGGLNPSTGETISNLFELSNPRKNCLAIWCRPGVGVGGRGDWRSFAGSDARRGQDEVGDHNEEEEEQRRIGKEVV